MMLVARGACRNDYTNLAEWLSGRTAYTTIYISIHTHIEYLGICTEQHKCPYSI